ncbi:uncharacterized protein LOC125177660 [Hyalella azteca]|uniref:Uncharacterized protein LOC125177660 n=1 Tax=Hyalella azteca TaxID=294128 RepID=A0A979FFU7_HYAAZ|nr:uncharacterized protein LOC125177660 [Hyalella azteca]
MTSLGKMTFKISKASSFLLLMAGIFSAAVAHETLIPPPPLITNQPYFDSTMQANLTSHVGRNAELHCRVHNIGNRTQISWIRGRDLRILTVGKYTYTTDLRYQATHLDGTNQWTLTIRSVQPRDEGHYDCQISTKPIKVFTTHLRVLTPKVEILGSPDLYVQRHSMINLTCVLHDIPEPPAYIYWFHRNKSISYSSSRDGISLVVEKGPTTSSHLLIRNARVQDSGDYTCSPQDMNSTSIRVHVLNGDWQTYKLHVVRSNMMDMLVVRPQCMEDAEMIMICKGVGDLELIMLMQEQDLEMIMLMQVQDLKMIMLMQVQDLKMIMLDASAGFKDDYADASALFKDDYADPIEGFIDDYAEVSAGFIDDYADASAGFKDDYAYASAGFKDDYVDASAGFKDDYADASAGFKDDYADASALRRTVGGNANQRSVTDAGERHGTASVGVFPAGFSGSFFLLRINDTY